MLQNHGYAPVELITHGMTKRLTMRLEPVCITIKKTMWSEGTKYLSCRNNETSFLELSKELLHQKLNTSSTTCL